MRMQGMQARTHAGRTWGLAVVALLMVGCEEPRVGSALDKPVMLSDLSSARGQQVFMQHCNQCHPGGAGGLAPPLNDKPLPEGLIKFQVRNGLGAMPAFDEGRISDAELDDLAMYLKELREVAGK